MESKQAIKGLMLREKALLIVMMVYPATAAVYGAKFCM